MDNKYLDLLKQKVKEYDLEKKNIYFLGFMKKEPNKFYAML